MNVYEEFLKESINENSLRSELTDITVKLFSISKNLEDEEVKNLIDEASKLIDKAIAKVHTKGI